jgi:hypothetical protein
MGLEGGPIVELFTMVVVLFPVCDGFAFTGCLVSDGGGVDGVEDVDGGDRFDGDWPVDGENGMFELNCADAILTELAIVVIPITIIAKIKMLPKAF